MRPLLTLSARCMLATTGLVLVVGIFGGLVRLMPFLVARDVPFSLAMPFARVLVSSALEVALLLGLPVGAAIGASLFVDRGEARALLSLGASPARLALAVAIPAVIASSGYLAAARSSHAEALGVLADRLLSAGRASCEASSPRRVDVPLVSLTWLCFPGHPRLVGHVPGLPDAWFSASSASPTADFGSIELVDLHVATRLGSRIATLAAHEGRLTGLPRWGASRPAVSSARSFLVALVAFALALAAAWLVVRRALSSPIVAAGGAALSALAALLALHSADARGASLAGYAAVPLASAVILAVLASLPVPGARVARRGAE